MVRASLRDSVSPADDEGNRTTREALRDAAGIQARSRVHKETRTRHGHRMPPTSRAIGPDTQQLLETTRLLRLQLVARRMDARRAHRQMLVRVVSLMECIAMARRTQARWEDRAASATDAKSA